MANKKIYADLAAAASLVATDVVPVVVDTAGTPTTKRATIQKILDLTFAFGIIQCPAGTSPTADAASDTLTLTSTGGTITITGNSGTDTINFDVTSPGIGGSTGSADNSILRADGVGGSTAQASGLFADDVASNSLGLHPADNSTADASVATSLVIRAADKSNGTGGTDAGSLTIRAGNCTGSSGARRGGNLTLAAGTSDSADPGSIILQTAGATALTITSTTAYFSSGHAVGNGANSYFQFTSSATLIRTTGHLCASADDTYDIGICTPSSDTFRPRYIVAASALSVGATHSSVPSSKAVLDLISTTKGALLPRMTTTQRDAITSVPTGLIVYNTSTNKLNFYSGSAWEAVTSA